MNPAQINSKRPPVFINNIGKAEVIDVNGKNSTAITNPPRHDVNNNK